MYPDSLFIMSTLWTVINLPLVSKQIIIKIWDIMTVRVAYWFFFSPFKTQRRLECFSGVYWCPPNVHPTLGMHQWDYWLLAWISDDTQDSLLTTDYSAGRGELEAEEEIKCFFLFLQPVSGLWPDRVNREEIRQTLSFMSANSHMLEVKQLH